MPDPIHPSSDDNNYDVREQVKTLRHDMTQPDGFGKIFAEAVEKSKVVDKAIKSLIRELIKTDEPVKNTIRELIESHFKDSWKSVKGRVTTLVWGAFIFIAGLAASEIMAYLRAIISKSN